VEGPPTACGVGQLAELTHAFLRERGREYRPVDKPKILTAKELRTIMPRLSGWKLANNKLSRTFEFQDFVQSLSFVNSLVAYFETVDHHPDVYIAYGEVTFEMWRWRRKFPPCTECDRKDDAEPHGGEHSGTSTVRTLPHLKIPYLQPLSPRSE
jgi:pterin-4a-carbinolamine dehydratase